MGKALWVGLFGKKRETRPRKFIRSMSASRADRMKEYAKAKRQFLRENPKCQRAGCRSKAKDLHHKRGRAGTLLTDTRHFAALCRTCHNWVGENIAAARAEGLICEPGLWNTPDKTSNEHSNNQSRSRPETPRKRPTK